MESTQKSENTYTRPKIISITGPTSTGKSSLAVRIAKKLNTEIISADSRQVFKEFNIATAKISSEEMQGIKHHFIDVLEPCDEFSAGDFVEKAQKIITQLSSLEKIPVIAGGTGLYLKMLLDGMIMPKSVADEKLRLELEAILHKQGNDALYEILVHLDSEFAKKLHPNDTYKVMRSIEILKHSNKTMAESRGFGESTYDVLKICLGANNREILYDKINKRVDTMMSSGLEREAETLYEKYPICHAFASTIGYQEFIPYFEGECTLDEAVEKIKRNTRRYAKRQLTWFRAQENVDWFFIDEMSQDEIETEVLELISSQFA